MFRPYVNNFPLFCRVRLRNAATLPNHTALAINSYFWLLFHVNICDIFTYLAAPVYSTEHQFLIPLYSCLAALNYHNVWHIRTRMLVSNHENATHMVLLSIHVNLEFSLCCKLLRCNFKHRNPGISLQISFMLSLHLQFSLLTCQLAIFVPLKMIINSLLNYLSHRLFALRRICDGFFGHYLHEILQCHPR